ncbi:ATP-binding cassette domain-containing protein [candidate division KSB1 bacterium]|nr:ATP-binding cassette domain-containing protein [candidate division KSB1 bacterium]
MKIASKSTVLVSTQDLCAGYGEEQILYDVSMEACKHEITAILGTSGCGKTTLLKNLIRLFQPWSGSVKIFNEEITDMDEPELNAILARVGVLFQYGALLNSITVAENVAIPLRQHTDLSESMIERLVRIKLDLVEMGHTLSKLPSELSGGMRKRAALARAIALDPPLLFCDEPTSGLDPMTSADLDHLILRMRDDLGISIVVVSHHVASIDRIADKIIFLDNGRVLFQGSLKEAKSAGIKQIDEFFRNG